MVGALIGAGALKGVNTVYMSYILHKMSDIGHRISNKGFKISFKGYLIQD